MGDPVVVCGLGETDHRFLDVLLGNIPFAFTEQIHDPLM
jgi:hypothetical protein